jgi:CRISPR system Cascade subunit CasE
LDFEGRLKIVDADRFKQALFEGIGSAKAFGCGLMLVRRI